MTGATCVRSVEVAAVEAVSSVSGGGLSVEVERTLPIAIVRAHGRLDAGTAPRLHAALIAALLDQPSGLLMDASDLEVLDEAALSVLASAAEQSARWPGTPVAVAAGPDVRAALDGLGVAGYPDLDEALLALTKWSPPSHREGMAPDRDAPARARAAVRDFWSEYGLDGGSDAAQLVASELVTNAVLHARTWMKLTLRLLPPLLHIAVTDGSPSSPHIAAIADETAESGRGLLLVDAMATAWGSLVSHDGKVVWATVSAPSMHDQRS